MIRSERILGPWFSAQFPCQVVGQDFMSEGEDTVNVMRFEMDMGYGSTFLAKRERWIV